MSKVLRLEPQGIVRTAGFSADKKYRYWLHRFWDAARPCAVFILLNPSTADEFKDDPTIRRCIAYAKAWDYGSLVILNLFAWRSTDPSVLPMIADPVGPDNMTTIEKLTEDAPLIICGWGTKAILDQDRKVLSMLRDRGRRLHALKVNESDGSPGHPLYLRGSLTPQPFGE